MHSDARFFILYTLIVGLVFYNLSQAVKPSNTELIHPTFFHRIRVQKQATQACVGTHCVLEPVWQNHEG